MKILIVDDEQDIREILTFTLETELTAEFLYAESGNKAKNVIKKNPDLDLIICDYNMPDGNGGDVYKFLLDENYDIPYVLCSSSKEEFPIFSNGNMFLAEITKPHLNEGIEGVISAYENLTTTEAFSLKPAKKNESQYSMISLDLLRLFETIPSDIFVRINSEKVVKVISQGDSLTKEEIDRYKEKQIKKLIIKKENAKEYLDILSRQIENIIQGLDNGEDNKVLDIHSVIMDTVRTLGISPQIIRATEKSVEFAINVLSKNQKFEDLAKGIFSHSSSYLSKHSIALAYIATGILSKLPWDSAETRNKLVMASFLHDAAIENPSFNEADVEHEDPESILTFKTHPNETYKLLSELKGLPPDVDLIILEHHERPDGTGFPKQLTATQIKPLSSVFIFAHDIVDIIFFIEKSGKLPDKTMILSEMNEGLYNVTNFKKSYEALKSLKIFERDN